MTTLIDEHGYFTNDTELIEYCLRKGLRDEIIENDAPHWIIAFTLLRIAIALEGKTTIENWRPYPGF